MTTFPFLSIPVLASNVIVKNLRLEDLIFLSTCSKRAYNSVKMANITLNRIQLKFDAELSMLIECPQQQITYLSFLEWNVAFGRQKFFDITHLNGVKVWWKSGVFLPFYSGGLEGKEEALKLIYEYFRGLFNVNKLNVCLRPGIVKDFFLWKTTKSINNLEIAPLRSLELYPSEAEIKFAVEELNARVLKIIPRTNYYYRYGLKQEEVHIEWASWLHKNALLNSESSRIWLSFPNRINASSLNDILKNWQARIGLHNLKHLIIHELHSFETGFQETVLKGIETVEWDPKNRPEDFENNKLGAGRDFRRADGTWATVLVDEENFIFHVWK